MVQNRRVFSLFVEDGEWDRPLELLDVLIKIWGESHLVMFWEGSRGELEFSYHRFFVGLVFDSTFCGVVRRFALVCDFFG